MSELGKKEVKEKFMKVAQVCFGRFGFKKATMDDIAHAAGKAKSSLYYYFKSKEEIMAAIASSEAKIMRQEIENAVDKEPDPKKKLYVYIITRLTSVVKVANYYNVLREAYIENYASLEKIRGQYDKEQRVIIEKIFQCGIEQGVFVINDLTPLVETFVIGLKGFELEWIEEKDLAKLKKHVSSLLDLFFYGIVKK